jgi:hypothetical protein
LEAREDEKIKEKRRWSWTHKLLPETPYAL